MTARTVKLTSKRQATFPAEVCRDLNLQPGDKVVLEHRDIGGESAWVISTTPKKEPWYGALHPYAEGKSHSMESIRKSIGEALGEEKS